MAAIVAEFNHVPRHSVSTYLPEWHSGRYPIILITTPWAVSYYCPHFADEETGPRGSSNLLESNSQQMIEPEFQLKWFNARAWAFNRKRDEECLGVAIWKEIQHFWQKRNMCRLLPSLVSWHQPETFAPLPGQHLFYFSKDSNSLCGDSVRGQSSL